MKTIYALALAAGLACSTTLGADARDRMTVTNNGNVYAIEAQHTIKGNDGDIEYALRYDAAKKTYDVVITIIADDRETGLMTIVNSKKAINMVSQQGQLLKADAIGTEKMRGTVVATYEARGISQQEVDRLAEASGDAIQLGAEGCWAVTFAASGKIFADMTAMRDKVTVDNTTPASPAPTVALAPVVISASVDKPIAAPADNETKATPATTANKPTIKPIAEGTPFKYKNDNALFKLSGTSIPCLEVTSSRMAKVNESIMRTKQCKTGAMNMSTGGVYIYSTNGFATTDGLPKDFITALRSLNIPSCQINEVSLTESNKWVIVYEKSGYKTGEGLPKAMLDRMQQCNVAKQQFKSIVMTDEGKWLVVTNKGWWCEGEGLEEFFAAAVKKYGKLQFGYFNPSGSMVAICKNGIECYSVPSNLVDALKRLEFAPKVIKFTDDGLYIITNNEYRAMFTPRYETCL